MSQFSVMFELRHAERLSMKNNSKIDELIRIAETKKETELCVSIFIPQTKSFDNNFENQLRPHVATFLDESGLKDADNSIVRSVTSKIADNVKLEDNKAEGYAVFILFDSSQKLENKKDVELQFIKVSSLYSQVDSGVFVGDTFNMIPLINCLQMQPASFGLDLTRDRATLYLFDKHESTHLHTFETEVMPEKDAEYNEMQGATGIFHGTGQNKIERRHEEENKHLLHQLKNVFTQMQDQVQGVGYIVVAYTSQFTAIIDPFIEELRTLVQPAEVLALPKNVRDAEELQQEAENLLHQHKIVTLQEKYTLAAEAFARFSDDQNSIFDAASQGSIQTLFLRSNETVSGYATPSHQFSESQSDESSIYYENILPLLVAHVCRTNGEVVVLAQEDVPLMAALLRYDKTKVASVSNED